MQSGNGGAGDTATATLTVQKPPAQRPPGQKPPPQPPPPGPAPAAEPALGLKLGARCVRPSRSGRVRVRLRMPWLAEPGPVQVRIQRGVGSKAMRKCPDPTAGRPFSGPFRTVVKRDPAAAGAHAAPRSCSA